MSSRYKLLFRGQIAVDQHAAVVRGRLQKLLKASDAQLDLMFSGNPVSIKKDVDEAGAERYLDAFMKAGAKLEIVELDAAALAEAARKAEMVAAALAHKKEQAEKKHLAEKEELARQAVQSEQRGTSASTEPATSDASVDGKAQVISAATADAIASFALSEVGADLVSSVAKAPEPVASVTTDHLSLAEAGGHLVEPAEASAVAPTPPVDTSHLSLDEAGATLGVPAETVATIDALAESDLELGEVGELLVESAPVVEPEILDLSNFQLESLPEAAD